MGFTCTPVYSTLLNLFQKVLLKLLSKVPGWWHELGGVQELAVGGA